MTRSSMARAGDANLIRARARSFHPIHRLGSLALLTLAIRAAPAAAADAAAPNPLARDYVDIGIHGGIAWRGNVADNTRYAPFGANLGATIDIGRAPYWGGIYADVADFGSRAGVVDPITDRSPKVVAISAGWRAKVAIQLAPRLYLFPALGAGFGRLEYHSSVVLPGPPYRIRSNNASLDGFSVTADATFAYVWRFGAVTLQPLRVSSFMFESNRNPPHPAGYDYGISRNSALLTAAIGVSVDPAAMVLAVWDAVENLSKWGLSKWGQP
jgi:hypothetical protein